MLKPFIRGLCKIFLIGLLLQFFLQTFVTFQMGWDGSFRNIVRMRKEFILLLLGIAVGYASLLQLPTFLKTPLPQRNLWEFLKKYPLLQGMGIFVLTALFFVALAIGVQKVGW
ncbi:MAG: hypothetical protein LBG59_08330 [Candidatus Peribacteria bacterium]|nr:hypothetical protein [Candidatus Peribacteria bacterium]